MTYQEQILPKDDREIYLAYVLFGTYAKTAREYGCNESAVRKRVKRYRERNSEEV